MVASLQNLQKHHSSDSLAWFQKKSTGKHGLPSQICLRPISFRPIHWLITRLEDATGPCWVAGLYQHPHTATDCGTREQRRDEKAYPCPGRKQKAWLWRRKMEHQWPHHLLVIFTIPLLGYAISSRSRIEKKASNTRQHPSLQDKALQKW